MSILEQLNPQKFFISVYFSVVKLFFFSSPLRSQRFTEVFCIFSVG